MCERRDARDAQNAAADDLATACMRLCENEVGHSLKVAWDAVIGEPIPEHLTDLLRGLK